MTGPKTCDDEVYSELSKTIQMSGKATPCSGKGKLFEASLERADDVLEAIELCRTCPLLVECRLAGRLLSTDARAGSVMGGIRYNSKGKQLLIGQLRKLVRGRVSVAELEGRAVDQRGGIDSVDAEASAA